MQLDASVAAIITGGASGLGAATARRLAGHGVRVALFDLQGREVAVLANGPQTVGHHRVAWNGEVDHAVAPAGVYFVRLTSPGGIVASNRFVVAH